MVDYDEASLETDLAVLPMVEQCTGRKLTKALFVYCMNGDHSWLRTTKFSTRASSFPMHLERCQVWVVLLAVACIPIGCEHRVTDASAVEPPSLYIARVIPTGDNPLSLLLACRTSRAALAAVDVLRDSVLEQTTPAFEVRDDSVIIPIVCLRPRTSYTFRVRLTAVSGETRELHAATITTQPLPAAVALPPFRLLHADSPSVKYVLVGITPASNGKSYAMVIDREAVPVWYKEFRDAVADFQRQPNGHLTAWSSIDGSPSVFYAFDLLGRVAATYRASERRETGPHELRLVADGYALFGIEFRTMDLTPYGGLPNASVRGVVVEWICGNRQLRWSTFDHFRVDDAAPDISLTTLTVNPWHGNAIELDHDGNLLASFRNMDEITKIDAASGAIIWRLGGRRNEFSFRGDPRGGFSHQHGIRRLSNGNILLFDNGNLHTPPQSRAVEYRLDEMEKIAELVWEYRSSPPLYAFALGFAQRLPNGNTLICFGTAQRIIEVDPSGRKRWDVALDEPQRYAYRAFAVESLY